MTRDDILRMAREADLTLQDDDGGEVSRWREGADLTPYIERFAALVAAAEREECANAVDMALSYGGGHGGGPSFSSVDVVRLIRARGTK